MCPSTSLSAGLELLRYKSSVGFSDAPASVEVRVRSPVIDWSPVFRRTVTVASGNVDPGLSQYQEGSGVANTGSFYLGVDPNGWTAFLQSSTDGLNLNSGGTSTLTRPSILGLGKPNS